METQNGTKSIASYANLLILATSASEASINLIALHPCGIIVTESFSAPHAESSGYTRFTDLDPALVEKITLSVVSVWHCKVNDLLSRMPAF